MTTITVIGKPYCHLCAVAREIVEVVVAETPDDRVVIEELSILDEPALYDLWWEKIPVVLIDGVLHAHWRVSADRRGLLRAPSKPTLSRPLFFPLQGQRCCVWPDFLPAYDATATLVKLMDLLAVTGRKLSEVVGKLPPA